MRAKRTFNLQIDMPKAVNGNIYKIIGHVQAVPQACSTLDRIEGGGASKRIMFIVPLELRHPLVVLPIKMSQCCS